MTGCILAIFIVSFLLATFCACILTERKVSDETKGMALLTAFASAIIFVLSLIVLYIDDTTPKAIDVYRGYTEI